uniref:Mitochondrial mRNA-processing protein COX24 C-terminal domain-containing protein n=1 Tax=Trichobilharzia regenti TaxID=157069 RepID=A0AA85JUR1_TRIRE|nr:unnamed protein product [Trichobilharzia regenti]
MFQCFRLLRQIPKIARSHSLFTRCTVKNPKFHNDVNILIHHNDALEKKYVIKDSPESPKMLTSILGMTLHLGITESNNLDRYPSQNIVPIQLKNDIKNRRRKMKIHQKRRLQKRHAVLTRKLQLMREKKEEKKLQELFEFWRIRSEAWDPAEKVENRLHLARRSGYYVDILKTKGSPFLKE